SEPTFVIPGYDPGYATPPPSSASADPIRGSFEWDLQRNYKLRWESLEAMKGWMKVECHDKSIEFIKKDIPARHPSITVWTETRVYVCARQGSGGKSAYQQKKNWTRKIGSKRTGCPCRLTVKTYPGTSEVLGFYKSDHTHATGDDNLKYMRLDAETRQEIENYL
ncbi:hypothetical protein C8F04DRAFT_1352234, partial [Mycena alexandri]